MFNLLEKITDQGIAFDDYEYVREKVSKYLRSKNSELDKISGILEKLNKEEAEYIVELCKKANTKQFSTVCINSQNFKMVAGKTF